MACCINTPRTWRTTDTFVGASTECIAEVYRILISLTHVDVQQFTRDIITQCLLLSMGQAPCGRSHGDRPRLDGHRSGRR
jgi:hypothetical protein